MSLLDELNADLKAAMLARDEPRKRAIRSIKTAISNAVVEKRRNSGPDAALSDQEVLQVINKEAKERRDSIEQFEQAGRTDLVAKEAADLAVLETYLPRQLDRDELVPIVQGIIVETGATGPQQIGIVMRTAMARLRDRADGKLVNQIARELLGGAA